MAIDAVYPQMCATFSLTKAGVRADIAEYLYGHKSRQSSAVPRNYSMKMPASDTVDLMCRLYEVFEWGFVEDYDE
jgi:hypothetical protein